MISRFLDRTDPGRAEAEQMIRDVYFSRYGAWIREFPERLAAVYDGGGAPVCAAGMREANGGFFSECYLDGPAERIIGQLAGEYAGRDTILEVTTLAATRAGAGFQLLDAVMQDAVARGMRWGLFTATSSLRNAFRRIGISLFEIVPAARSRVGNPESWGTYYETDPMVCVIEGRRSALPCPVPAALAPREQIAHA